MTLTDTRPDEIEDTSPTRDLTTGDLAGRGVMLIALAAVVLGVLSWLPFGGVNWARWAIVSLVAYIVLTYVVSRIVESRRHATDRLATALVTSAFIVICLPLVSVMWTVVENGATRFDWSFFSDTRLGVTGEGGGAYHAIVGTLVITGLTALLAVPFGIFTAIYLVEYGRNSRFSKAVTSMVDVMTGIPSIVAGLFAYSFFVSIGELPDSVPIANAISTGVGHRSGLAAAVALTLLMTPVVVRATEEMLRLVPDELREASYALGVPRWKTIVKVVLPTAIAGILTGVVLAVARVIGETAPLLVTVGIINGVNKNPLEGRMATLPVYAYNSYAYPSLPREASIDRMWTGSLVLMLVVALLFTTARVLSHVLKPKGER